MQRHVAELALGPRFLFFDAEVVPLRGQPEVLQGRDVLEGRPAVDPDLHAIQTVNLLLALESGDDLGELVDRAAPFGIIESRILGMSVDRLGPAEVDREREVDEVVGQRQAVRGVNLRVLEAAQVDIDAVAGDDRASPLAIVG